VTAGVPAFSAALFVLNACVAAVLIPPHHLGSVVGGPVGLAHYARVVLPATVLGVVAGAVGSGLEDPDVVRRVAYGHRRAERAPRPRPVLSSEAKNLSPAGKAVRIRVATMGGRRVAIEEAAMRREDIVVPSGGQDCAGWLYHADTATPAGTVVMAHGLAAVKEMQLDAYAEGFARAGYHVLVFDYRHFGASGGQPRQLLDIRRQHEDWAAAVGYARSVPEVDPAKVALWGTSLAGGHVLALADELRAAAVIAQVPHVDGLASVAALGPRQVLRLTGHGLLDAGRALLRMPPHYVPATGEPGTAALMTAPEAAGYLRLVPPGMPFDQRVAARFALRVGLYSPGRALRRLKVPTLVQVGTNDRTTPPGPAVKAASGNPRVTLSTFEAGHFEPYTGELFETFLAEQIAFLDKTLA
jgi:pimeloyl-ACP methyl ester carboxylesterase